MAKINQPHGWALSLALRPGSPWWGRTAVLGAGSPLALVPCRLRDSGGHEAARALRATAPGPAAAASCARGTCTTVSRLAACPCQDVAVRGSYLLQVTSCTSPCQPGVLGGEEGGGGSLAARSVSCLHRSCVLSRAWPSLAGGQLGGRGTNIKPKPRTGRGGRVRFQTSVCSPGKALNSYPNPITPAQAASWATPGSGARQLGGSEEAGSSPGRSPLRSPEGLEPPGFFPVAPPPRPGLGHPLGPSQPSWLSYYNYFGHRQLEPFPPRGVSPK